MPKMNISRSIKIEAPTTRIYEKLSNFNEWIPWSPWLIMDPNAKVTVGENAKSYAWEGSRVGSGNMSILSEKENEFIECDLIFLKPWKSKAKTSFVLKEADNFTTVTWKMDSSLPFFMFFMKGTMEAYVGADYERGLDMLKVYVETGSVPSDLKFVGNNSFEGCRYIGVKTTANLSTVGDTMSADFEKIGAYVEGREELMTGDALSIYHKWDLPKNSVSYTSGVQVKEIPADLPEDFVFGELPATKLYTVRHTGSYEYLGNAWSTMYTMQRNKEFKNNKKIAPFEFYRNNPKEVVKNELITDVNFALL